MKRVYGRRAMLRGAGIALPLPMLPSLWAREAVAAAAMPRFVCFTTEHGGVAPQTMFPPDALLASRGEAIPGHEARWGALARRIEGMDAVVSPVLRARATALTDRMVARMNVLRGVDVPFYINHNTGGHLGNYLRNNTEDVTGSQQARYNPTVDQVMAWSPSFYPNMTGVRARSIHAGEVARISYNYSNPSARTGAVQEIKADRDPLALFDRLIGGAAPGTPAPAPRKPVVDRVIESYRLLRNGNRRLSPGDRQRLDDHMDRLAELERVVAAPVKSCGTIARPGAPGGDKQKMFAAINDVIAAAFICGTSRIAVVSVGSPLVPYSGDWHQNVAHSATDVPAAAATLALSHRTIFENVVLDLAVKLDVAEAEGSTFLDNTLVTWSQESGYTTHESNSTPIVTFGGAAGYFKTGLYCDYRNLAPSAEMIVGYVRNATAIKGHAGLVTHHRWLATLLAAMRVPRTDWPRFDGPGFGAIIVSDEYRKRQASGVMERAGDPLPFIKA